jgi:hypothetical protein
MPEALLNAQPADGQMALQAPHIYLPDWMAVSSLKHLPLPVIL